MTDMEKQGIVMLVFGMFFLLIYKIDPNSSVGNIPVWIFLAQVIFGLIFFLWGGKKKIAP